MPVVNGIKMSCAPCMRGHRATSCLHRDRKLHEVRKPGRPLTSCPHIEECSCGFVTANKLGSSKESVSATKPRKFERKMERKLEKKLAKRKRVASPEQREIIEIPKYTPEYTSSASPDLRPIPFREDKEEGNCSARRRSHSLGEILSPLSPVVAPADDRPVNSSHYIETSNSLEVPNSDSQRPELPEIIHSKSYVAPLPSMNVPPSPLLHTLAHPMAYTSYFPSPFNFQKPGSTSISNAMTNRRLPPPYFHKSRIEDVLFYNHAREAPQTGLGQFDQGGNMNRMCGLGV